MARGDLGLALPALVIERTGVFGALGRSRALVRGRFWAVLGLLVLAFLVTLFSAGLVGAIAGAFAAPPAPAARRRARWRRWSPGW